MNDNLKINNPYVGLTDHNHQELDYTDGELAIINHLTFSSRMHATHIDMVFIVICSQGELRFEMDGSEHVISKDDVFVGYPNAIYNHFEASQDLRCRLLCLTKSKKPQLRLRLLPLPYTEYICTDGRQPGDQPTENPIRPLHLLFIFLRDQEKATFLLCRQTMCLHSLSDDGLQRDQRQNRLRLDL